MKSQYNEECGNPEMGKYAPVWMSGARQKSIKHQYAKQERDQMLPKVSSIKENIVTTILQSIYKSLSK